MQILSIEMTYSSI